MTDKWNEYENREYLSEKLLKYKISYFTNLFNKFGYDINKTVIEIGAGHGISSEIFASIFKNYIATEPNKLLFDKLLELKNNKYNHMIVKKTNLENMIMKDDKKINMIIFAYSFQFIEYSICIAKINEFVCKNGFILILLPFKPFKFEDFDKNKNWRKQINNTIKLIINDDNFELLYLTKEENYIILLKKITEIHIKIKK